MTTEPRRQPLVSIRAKLLMASAVLLVASTLLYGYVAFTTAQSALLPSIREQLADDAVNVKGGLEEMLTAHYRNVQTWARLSMMRELVVHDMDKTVARFLEAVKRDYGVYVAVLALDRHGTCIASSRAADIGLDFSGTPLAPSASPQTAASLEWSGMHQAWYVRLASPIPDPDNAGATLGTLVAMLDRRVLDRIVVSKPGHSQVELRLFDGNDRLIAGRPMPVRLERVETWRVGRGANPDRFPAGLPPILQEGTDAGGQSFIIAEVPIGDPQSVPTPGWRLTASARRERALAPVAAVRDRVLATGVGLALFGLFAAMLLADRLARPIKDLTSVAARIARTGDLEPVPEPTSHDEVGELARAFQRMVTAVADANEEMVRQSKLAFLGEMVAGIAHEIRTPLGIIRSSSQLLERRMGKAGDAEALEWSVFIREESDRLARVVTELLDFAKPVPPMKTAVDLGDVVARAVSLLAAEASSRGVSIDMEPAAGPIVVECDADQVRQVCLNLVLNALQASEREGVVSIAVERRGDNAEICVRDRGRGIPPELVGRLFEPFTSQRDGGIGLGLAIVRRIVRAHGGEVVARNRSGGGAEFVVSLPIVRRDDAKESHEA